ncbi:MAG TPA: adenosylhomocysteinase [Candidatus Dormibacteraeota bacterium]|nr:adenosylhomocysteinase [Candidatus Dormibacteraeota bacterium]
MSSVKDPALAPTGRVKIQWARNNMPVLARIAKRFATKKVFKGHRVGMCLHLEAKTAALSEVFLKAGAEVAITGSNPLSTQDDVAAALAETGVHVYAWRGVSASDHEANLERVLAIDPDVLIDDGAELTIAAHSKGPRFVQKIIGACEETTTGVTRLKAMEREGRLKFPVIAVNDAYTKFLFDSRYGTGQSGLEGIMRATNLLIAGRTIVVAGFGWVGRGVAQRAKGMGARVIVTEVDPVRALEALMEGFDVMPMSEAAACGDLFVTATGNTDIITGSHMVLMKDKAILCNVGHYDVEVSVLDLERIATSKRQVRPEVTEYRLRSGKKLYLLSNGRLVNLAAADGHPAEVMDMSFSGQALSGEYLLQEGRRLKSQVIRVPEKLDVQIARWRLESFGKEIDSLTRAQERYAKSWRY